MFINPSTKKRFNKQTGIYRFRDVSGRSFQHNGNGNNYGRTVVLKYLVLLISSWPHRKWENSWMNTERRAANKCAIGCECNVIIISVFVGFLKWPLNGKKQLDRLLFWTILLGEEK